ncbi:MAG: HlyD family secretion protein [Vicinamibacterales bacterium]
MTHPSPTPARSQIFLALVLASTIAAAACAEGPPPDRVRVSGQIEATDVQVSALVGGRLLDRPVNEGARVDQGQVLAVLDTADAQLALARAKAERDQVAAQLRLLQAGSRVEEIRQAEAQVSSSRADLSAAEADLTAAEVDVDRFERLLASDSGSRKQRDDAVARRNIARERAQAARERVRVSEEALARVRAGARPEELDAVRARLAAADVQIATFEKAIADATVRSPLSGVVTTVIADPGEIVQPRTPLLIVSDIDRAWANVYVDEPIVPRLRLGDAATVVTDAGGPGVTGRISYISERAEFTPRNVQTADDRSKLVYRLKVAVDNSSGLFKPGMPVEAEIPLVR